MVCLCVGDAMARSRMERYSTFVAAPSRVSMLYLAVDARIYRDGLSTARSASIRVSISRARTEAGPDDAGPRRDPHGPRCKALAVERGLMSSAPIFVASRV